MLMLVEVLLYGHRNRRLVRDGSPDGHLDFHTAPELCVTFAAAAAVVFLNVLGCRLTY